MKSNVSENSIKRLAEEFSVRNFPAWRSCSMQQAVEERCLSNYSRESFPDRRSYSLDPNRERGRDGKRRGDKWLLNFPLNSATTRKENGNSSRKKCGIGMKRSPSHAKEWLVCLLGDKRESSCKLRGAVRIPKLRDEFLRRIFRRRRHSGGGKGTEICTKVRERQTQQALEVSVPPSTSSSPSPPPSSSSPSLLETAKRNSWLRYLSVPYISTYTTFVWYTSTMCTVSAQSSRQ